MKKTYLQKGFTLIELLVVIAIIGILSSVVLASLSGARNKGKIAAVQSELNSAKQQAELGNSTGLYIANLCTTAGTTPGGIKTILDKVLIDQGNSGAVLCFESTTLNSWAAEADLNGVGNSGTTKYFCVDSSGFSGFRSGALTAPASGADAVCPTS